MRKPNRQQRLFVYEYLVNLNATEAATKAGYSKKTAEQIGYQLLQNPSVRNLIEEKQREREKVAEISAEKVIKEIADIAFIKMEDFILYIGKGCVIKLSDKLKALEMLCRIKGMFKDNANGNSNNTGLESHSTDSLIAENKSRTLSQG